MIPIFVRHTIVVYDRTIGVCSWPKYIFCDATIESSECFLQNGDNLMKILFHHLDYVTLDNDVDVDVVPIEKSQKMVCQKETWLGVHLQHMGDENVTVENKEWLLVVIFTIT